MGKWMNSLAHWDHRLQFSVLVHTDYQAAAAACIYRQGGVRSAQLVGMARWLLLWKHTHLLSIRVEYILGVLNRGADIMLKGGPRPDEWHHSP